MPGTTPETPFSVTGAGSLLDAAHALAATTAAVTVASTTPVAYGRFVVKLVLNLIWLIFAGWILGVEYVLAGWWLALSHLFTGAWLILTIIGIPLGIGSIKMAGAAISPFGKEIVRTNDPAAAARVA
jgi:uncharacterized membrane protein YccF (DUF307 family)